MLKLRFVIVLCVLFAITLLAGCNGNGDIKASLDEEFTLAVGETASIQGESMEITFTEMKGDSRCPKGATCIWQGEVNCKMNITYKGLGNTIILTQPGLSAEPAVTTFNEYQIYFSVQPYPEVGTEIAEGDYRLILTVSK